MTYSNAYGRFSVADNVCGFSFANTDAAGNVAPQALALQASIFATGNGVPPTTGVNIVFNNSSGGAKLDLLAVSPSTGNADFALDGAICHRNLLEGRDIVTGAALTGAMKAASDRVREGIAAVTLTTFLKNTPAIVVQGRSDALVPVNQSSRAYYASNQARAPGVSQLRYIEVTNAQHFDAFLPAPPVGSFPGYDSALRAAARLPDPLARLDVRPPDKRKAASAVASRAHHAARRHARRRATDHRRQCPTDLGDASGWGPHHLQPRHVVCARLRSARAPAQQGWQ